MRITVFLPFLLVLCSIRGSFQMVINTGLESLPETSQDSSSDETAPAPEVTDVPYKNPETDLLNDVNLPQLSTDRAESSATSKEKRCARRETIVGSPRNRNAVLSLNRRDTNLEKRKQQCENCKNRRLCSKYKACAACKRYCGKVKNETTDVNAPVTEPGSIIVENREEVTENVNNNEAIVAARFGESSEESTASKPRYYSLGSVQPGPLMHLFAKAFNFPSEQSFEKLIILGQVKGSPQIENLDELVIIDLAQVFGTDNKHTATVHQSNANIDPAKIEELDRAFDAALARRKQELNTDQLSTQQIHEVIDQVLEEINRRKMPVENEVAATDPSVQLQETQTKCSVDEAVDDLIEIMSASAPERAQETKHEEEKEPMEAEGKIEGEESTHQIKNPPVIQDSAILVGKNLEDGWVDDNEEARPSVMIGSGVQKPNLLSEDSRKIALPNDINPVNNMIGAPPKEAEVLTLPDEAKLGLESDNQINNNPVESNQQPGGDSHNEIEDIAGRVGDPNDESSPRQTLEENILKIVEDSLKTVSDSDHLSADKNLGDIQNKDDKENLVEEPPRTNYLPNEPIIEEQPKLVFAENVPYQANTENQERTIPVPQTSGSTPLQLQNENQKDIILGPKETAKVTDKFTGMQNTETVTEILKKLPDFVNRGQFSDESVSQEKLTSFGALVPAAGKMNEDSPMKKLYFVGKDIKLPLQMIQDENGVMQLRVDMKKLCYCKNKNCTRKHADSREVEQTVNEKEYSSEQSTILPELSVRFGRDSHRNEQLMDSFMEGAHDENSDKHKRSPKIDSEYKLFLTDQRKSKQTAKNDELIKLEKEDEKLENKIEKLSEDIEKYNEENLHLLNKGNVALFKDVEKTKDVGRMITVANNVLSWMKELAAKNLHS